MIESAERAKLAQFSVGAAAPPRKRVYCDVENGIARLKEQLYHQELQFPFLIILLLNLINLKLFN